MMVGICPERGVCIGKVHWSLGKGEELWSKAGDHRAVVSLPKSGDPICVLHFQSTFLIKKALPDGKVGVVP